MKIGLTYTGTDKKHQNYVNWLKSNDDIEIITLSAESNNLDDLKQCDALVLSGGIDIHPRFYGNANTQYNNATNLDEKRDEFEMAAFDLAQENKLPVLGICRGMQLINVIHKGTMTQDLGEEKLLTAHKGNPDKLHPVKVKSETILSKIVSADSIQTNSAHHQAIDKLGQDLIANAFSEEGIVEGIERKETKNKPFLLAIQWHPERMHESGLENSAGSAAIRKRFIEEVKKSINENH